MVRYVVRRVLLIPGILFLIVSASYAYAHVVRWDYASRYPQLQRQLVITGYPESLAEAYADYVRGLLRLDFGTLRNGEPIDQVMQQALPASLGLLAAALAVSVPLGLGLGMLGAEWRRLRPAPWLTALSTVGMAMPSFYVGSLFILIMVMTLLVRRGDGRLLLPIVGFGWDEHMVLPVLALMVRPTVQVAQVTATLLTGELQKPYVAAARSLGHARSKIKRHLAFRNVLAPVLLTVATSLRMLVVDLILVEWLFFWPGIGRFIASALIPSVRTNMVSSPYLLDPEFTAALLATVAAIFLIADFLASVLVRVFDPRLRVPGQEALSNV
jgi:peptide/nickel transport system permease protein